MALDNSSAAVCMDLVLNIDHGGMPMLRIIEVNAIDQNLLDGLNALLPQLSTSADKMTMARLRKILDCNGCFLFTAVAQQRILGCLMLTVFPILTDMRAWIDDVVVCASARGQGIGRQLLVRAIQKAETLGVGTINLTSNPRRREALRLYRRVGFQPRDTHTFRYTFF